jgi:hypothetical protein
MDNQHKKIKGYRELGQREIDLMNKIKEMSSEVGNLMSELDQASNIGKLKDHMYASGWINTANQHLQQGFMCAVRAVAQPETY